LIPEIDKNSYLTRRGFGLNVLADGLESSTDSSFEFSSLERQSIKIRAVIQFCLNNSTTNLTTETMCFLPTA
jgi:hypothetical protein